MWTQSGPHATQHATCSLSHEKLNSRDFFSFLFFISSVEEGECSRKNILKKQNKLAKKNKHGILVLRLNFV